ncbi:hypothetical protein [Mesorhizobium sp.]|uniref:hypothetical protein n=1 Tax=Mesorhizobium sp. TaxID=1871066 RepID=UPI000FE9C65A|nr:hypothetical protein [Mesorhizobium sp.]RWC58557.1 MAG: hypothetical protein EOS29_23135 [Mesorhizobium sp.]RWC62163.1 MAG: hypothetical protein EOS56_09110 [Mesorhizobium sp.]
MDFEAGVVLVVGAGFAKNAGLPLANEFTERLLDVDNLRGNGPSAAQAAFLRRFVDETFNDSVSTPDDKWPELEDIFTLVDQSANSGHHLGRRYSAADLRVVRRAMIVRIVRMLQQAYDKQMKRRDADSKLLNALFDGLNLDNTAVLSMNWDMVFERGIALRQEVRNIEYGCHATPARFQGDQVRKRRSAELGTGKLHLLKPHGSINWLYCDACRELFWVPPNDTERVAQTLFQDRDWRAVFGATDEGPYPKSIKPHCPHCSSQSLGTRIATFSYRKALDFPMHAATWRTAEEHLKAAIHWVFFGYSMPAADFEFKYLLKRVQLTESIPPDITVITGGSSKAADETIRRYKQFFGDGPGERHYFRDGLTEEVVSHLRSIEALNPDKPTRRSSAKSASRRS